MNLCRICRYKRAKSVGYFRPYSDLDGFEVFDCLDCGCRFVWRKEEVHEGMHASKYSPYSFHEKIANEVSEYFHNNQLHSLKQYLSKTPKFRFVIDRISQVNKNAKIFELGCSLGYLTSYFILARYDVIGADISSTAIQKARSYFGKHFIGIDKQFYDQANCFDFVYHLGTIGCVNNPIAFTKVSLNLLRPGGKLLFNAPDVKAAREMGAIWNNSTPPPDLITLFDESFWENQFKDLADVDITYEPYCHYSNAAKHIDKLLNRPYLDPKPKLFHKMVFPKASDKLRVKRILRRIMIQLFYYLSKLNIIHQYKPEFGMFVSLTKK